MAADRGIQAIIQTSLSLLSDSMRTVTFNPSKLGKKKKKKTYFKSKLMSLFAVMAVSQQETTFDSQCHLIKMS